jgi:hypothetical protein
MHRHSIAADPRHPPRLVGVPGIEPGTSSLSGTRSNHLSYTPGIAIAGLQSRSRRTLPAWDARLHPSERRLVEATGFEPVTPSLQSLCSAN